MALRSVVVSEPSGRASRALTAVSIGGAGDVQYTNTDGLTGGGRVTQDVAPHGAPMGKAQVQVLSISRLHLRFICADSRTSQPR